MATRALGTWSVVIVLLAITAGPAGAQDGPTPRGPVGDALVPDTILVPPERPRIVVLDAPGSPVVTLRATVALEEGPAEGGAGRLLATLGVDRARSFAGPVSARIEGGRTPTGLAYSVSGARQDLDYLAYLLRVALSEPRPSRIDFQRARSSLIETVRRASETPSRRVARTLRERAFPTVTPTDGTLGSLQVVTPSTLRDVWRRTHRPSGIDVYVVGDIATELLLVSVQGMGAPEGPTGEPPSASAPPDRGGTTQVLRRWYGEARVLPDSRDPRGAVAALLVAQHMRTAASSFEAHVELWQVGERQALAVMGAAYSSSAGAMRNDVENAVRATSAGLDPASLEAAVGRVRKDALFEARSPWGRAEVAARHLSPLSADRDPGAARSWFAALDDITVGSMREYLATLAARTPVRTEVTP